MFLTFFNNLYIWGYAQAALYTYSISPFKIVVLLKWVYAYSIIIQCNALHFHSYICQWVLGRNWNYDLLSTHTAVLTEFFCLIYRSQASFCLRSSFLRSRKRSAPSCRGSRQSQHTCSSAKLSHTHWSDAFILHWLLSHLQHIFLGFISLCFRAFSYSFSILVYILLLFDKNL